MKGHVTPLSVQRVEFHQGRITAHVCCKLYSELLGNIGCLENVTHKCHYLVPLRIKETLFQEATGSCFPRVIKILSQNLLWGGQAVRCPLVIQIQPVYLHLQ